MTEKFIVDPLRVRGLQIEVNKNLWAAYENQNSAYIDCLTGFHKMSMEDRMKFFGTKSIEPIETSNFTELYDEEEIFIDECGGNIESGLHVSNDLFNGDLSSNFKDWNLINPQPRTEKTKVKVLEIDKNADYNTLFGLFGTDLEKLYLTQAQIRTFCKNHKEKLRKDGYFTFFLVKEGTSFFVVRLSFDVRGRLDRNVDKLKYDVVWTAGYRRRIVVPATALIKSET